jgi:FAD/FMN-containing dehydrogenase
VPNHLTASIDYAAVRAELGGIALESDRALLRQKSRDFFWFSPILKQLLWEKSAELIACPADEAEVMRVAAVAARHKVPLTCRGGGTGNYGQCVPLAGGIVMDMTRLDRVLWLKSGVVRVEAGKKMAALNDALAPHGHEMRLYASTVRTATVGGYICGGAGGVGSVNHGLLSNPGNVLAARLITCEESPRALELRGADLKNVLHAYGTTGIVTELELPVGPTYDWVDVIFAAPDFPAAFRFCKAVAEAPGIVKREVAAIDWPAPSYFKPLAPFIVEGRPLALLSVADFALPAIEQLIERAGLDLVYRKTRAEQAAEALPPIYEYGWNHATFHAQKADKAITYLQCGFPAGRELATIQAVQRQFGDEVTVQLEFVRIGGVIGCFGLHLVRFTSAERLAEIVAIHRVLGVSFKDAHTVEVEHNDPKPIHREQAAFKRTTDPHGLLNPGKLRSFSSASV